MKKILFLAFIANLCFSVVNAQTFLINGGAQTELTEHPSGVRFNAGKKTYYKLFSNGVGMFVTADKKVFKQISNHLPVVIVAGHSVAITGSAIVLGAILTRKQLGNFFEKTGIDLSRTMVYEVTSYQLKSK